MSVDLKTIKELRQVTGAGMVDVKNALDEASGDIAKAKDLLRQRGIKIAAKKQSREASQGIIDTYIHPPGKVASLVVLLCETDFVAMNSEFKALAHDIAKQVAAMSPEDVNELLDQVYIVDNQKQIKDLITEATAKLGEKIEIREFFRIEL